LINAGQSDEMMRWSDGRPRPSSTQPAGRERPALPKSFCFLRQNGPFGPSCPSTFPDESHQTGGIIPLIFSANTLVLREESLAKKVNFMTWTSPVFEEVVLCCEINSYVSAKL
jgi:hypothetical protein